MPKRRRIQQPKEGVVDATPERLTKGDSSEFINPARIDSAEQPIGHVRRFSVDTKLDKWHRGEVINQRQFAAGHEYRRLHGQSVSTPRVIASYGQAVTGGETDYGMSRTVAHYRIRKKWRSARASMDVGMVGFMDRFLIRDDLPNARGRAQMKTIAAIKEELDKLASHFERNP